MVTGWRSWHQEQRQRRDLGEHQRQRYQHRDDPRAADQRGDRDQQQCEAKFGQRNRDEPPHFGICGFARLGRTESGQGRFEMITLSQSIVDQPGTGTNEVPPRRHR